MLRNAFLTPQVLAAQASGGLLEVFGTGTAATVTPVGNIRSVTDPHRAGSEFACVNVVVFTKSVAGSVGRTTPSPPLPTAWRTACCTRWMTSAGAGRPPLTLVHSDSSIVQDGPPLGLPPGPAQRRPPLPPRRPPGLALALSQTHPTQHKSKAFIVKQKGKQLLLSLA